MDVSIIIVNYNSIDLTIDCVNSIFQQTADVKFEIIIVDNASKNKEAERLHGGNLENSVKMIEAKKQILDLGKANQSGNKIRSGGLCSFFLIPIQDFDEQCRSKILWEEMKNNPDMGCTGGKFIYAGENAVSVFLFKV